MDFKLRMFRRHLHRHGFNRQRPPRKLKFWPCIDNPHSTTQSDHKDEPHPHADSERIEMVRHGCPSHTFDRKSRVSREPTWDTSTRSQSGAYDPEAGRTTFKVEDKGRTAGHYSGIRKRWSGQVHSCRWVIFRAGDCLKLILANLALSLQQTSGQSLGRTARIGLLDLDIFGPSVPKLMGLEGHEPEMTPGTLDLN